MAIQSGKESVVWKPIVFSCLHDYINGALKDVQCIQSQSGKAQSARTGAVATVRTHLRRSRLGTF